MEVFVSEPSGPGGLHLLIFFVQRSLPLGLLGVEVFTSKAFSRAPSKKDFAF
jgi:hypothetical protein